MKATKSIFASLVLIFVMSVSAYAETNVKVIAVINKAAWCPVCQKNGKRAMTALMKANKDMAVKFVANNLTNAKTKQKSKMELTKLGLEKAMAKNNGTGMVYFFNAKTKNPICNVSVAQSDDMLIMAVKNAEKDCK